MSKVSKITSAVINFFTYDKIILLVILVIAAFLLMNYSGSKSMKIDGMETGSPKQPSVRETAAQNVEVPPAQGPSAQVGGSSVGPQDLLPKDQNSQWAALNPSAMNQGSVVMPDLLQAGYHIGLDTIGQTLKNANLQLRSDPIIPKVSIGPWSQSTIEPDVARVPLEIGGCQ